MGTHPQFSASGPSAPYSPKTTDESDSSTSGGVVLHVNPQVNGLPVSSTNPAPSDTVIKGAAVNRSGTISAGGTAQQLMAANTARRGFRIQNQSSGALYFSATGTATADQNSFLLNAGDYFESSPHFIGTSAVSIIGATTGQAFHATEF